MNDGYNLSVTATELIVQGVTFIGIASIDVGSVRCSGFNIATLLSILGGYLDPQYTSFSSRALQVYAGYAY